ncbi:MAG: VWA domain-containing protein [Gammaproteobacteria bacterium]|jgi:hypothetical protein
MKRRRRSVETLNLSFLDAISCGFGAVILLLVIAKIYEPIRLEESQVELDLLVARMEEELQQIIGETNRLERERQSTSDSIVLGERQIDALRERVARIRADILEQRDDAEFSNELEGRLALAKQSLTDEMRRLLADYRPPLEDYKVGGIPVDSEYIIFIIDTSGSMRSYAWDRVQQQIRETLEVYPTVKGIQVLNDDGQYMFRSYRNQWIPDTPEQREAILERLEGWRAISNSSPREGILAAIDTFYDPDKKISLYVYSDDFSAGAGQINAVVREVDRRNALGADGEKRVRIHAVAFPVYYEVTGNELLTAADFAILMRALCLRNGGTFVALPSRRDI